MSWDNVLAVVAFFLKRIDVAAVFALFVVPAITAYISGKIGVRRGLEQSRNQRAFERRLEWYEKTFSAFGKLAMIERKLSQSGTAPEAFKAVADEFLKCAEEVRVFVDGAPVYAQRKTLVNMRKLFVELDATRNLASGPKIEDSDLARKQAAIGDIINRIMYELALSIRKQLRLDKIKPEDVGWGKKLS